MKHIFKSLFAFTFALVMFGCSQPKEQTGKATFTGKFSGIFPAGEIYNIKVSVPNMVFGTIKQSDEYETTLELDGSFSLSMPLYCPVYAMLSINENNCGAILLSPDKETKIELSLNDTSKFQFKMLTEQGLSLSDLDTINAVAMEFFYKLYNTENSLSGLRYNMPPNEYKNYLLQWTENQISVVKENQNLSADLKQITISQIKWSTYIGLLFDYEGQLRFMYENQATKDTTFMPVKLDKSYYSFLRFFDLNNPPKIFSPSYSAIYQEILNNDVLNIPIIENISLQDWLKEVKTTMSGLIGADNGIFYDFLTLYAYSKQLDESQKPLSDKQITDIKNYFKNPTFIKFLFTKNDAVKTLSKLSAIVNETPKVAKEQIIEAVAAKHKGKVVVMDFWATWCSPCLQAIEEIKTLKAEMFDRNIVWVYVTDESSSTKVWEKKITGIGGEHYYLTADEWKSISKKYEINSIPTYIIFDNNGNIADKFSGYSGNDEMRKILEKVIN